MFGFMFEKILNFIFSLLAAKKQISESVTTVKQSEMELKHATNQLKTKTGELKSNDAAYLRDKKSSDAIEAEIKKLEVRLKVAEIIKYQSLIVNYSIVGKLVSN